MLAFAKLRRILPGMERRTETPRMQLFVCESFILCVPGSSSRDKAYKYIHREAKVLLGAAGKVFSRKECM